MDILVYITELLQSHKTIGIVGLGTLYKKKSPGKYDAEKHAFVPPTYALAFTTEVKEPEWLAALISEKRNITLDSSNYYIGEFVAQIQAQLAEQQEADLGTIGKLKLVNDELILSATNENSFGFEFYGLPTLTDLSAENTLQNNSENNHTDNDFNEGKLEEVTQENKFEEENPGQDLSPNEEYANEQAKEVYLDQQEQLIANEYAQTETPNMEEEKVEPIKIIPQVSVDEDDMDDDDYDKPLGQRAKNIIKWIVTFLVIIVIIGLAYFFNPQFFDNQFKIYFGDSTEIESAIMPADTASLKLDSTNLGDTTTSDNNKVTLAKDSTTIDSSKVIIYEVIGSAEKSKKRVDQFIQNMNTKGIIAKPLKTVPGKLTKISLGSFTDYNLAQKYQDSLKKKLNNPQIYIQSIKPKK